MKLISSRVCEDELDELEALSDEDLHPEECMFTIGEYFARNLTKRQFKYWLNVVRPCMSKKKLFDDLNAKAQLVAKLTYMVILDAYSVTGFHDMEHSGSLLHNSHKGTTQGRSRRIRTPRHRKQGRDSHSLGRILL